MSHHLAKWFKAAEATGDFMGIRYGRKPEGSSEVEWSFVSHIECDGIGGFARLLREAGAELRELPQTTHPNRQVIRPLWNLIRKKTEVEHLATRQDWIQESAESHETGPLAWHLFTEEETEQIRQRCRQQKVTVNSYLLKHLDHAVRADIKSPSAALPWLIPVNLRGDISSRKDTENHVSCVEPILSMGDSAACIQAQIQQLLKLGEHRENYLMLMLGGFLPQAFKAHLITKSRARSKGNIGSFSNLGIWDKEKALSNTDAWFFCPPVCKGQRLGAGCVSFQNRLSLTLQAHASLADQPEIAQSCMTRWINETL